MQKPNIAAEANFKNGFVTEYTGLNFPEQAATATSNMVYERIGNVHRRPGINYELNHTNQSVNRNQYAMSNYKWNNASGDGVSQLEVIQIGKLLYFYQTNTATIAAPISTKFINTIDASTFQVGVMDVSIECQYSDANGFLFVFHPNCDPFYVTFNTTGPTVVATKITIQTRDLQGLPDNLAINARIVNGTGTKEHTYNLYNQGWNSLIPTFPGWSTTSFTLVAAGVGNNSPVQVASAALPLYVGEPIQLQCQGCTIFGVITSISGTTIFFNQLVVTNPGAFPAAGDFWYVTSSGISPGFNPAAVFAIATNLVPSNTDIWFQYKDVNGVFDPFTVLPQNFPLTTTPAPKGHFLLSAFNLDRTTASGLAGLTIQTTNARPSTGCWFQGRIWYSGVNGTFPASGDAPYYTWTENIYFSQIIDTTIQTTGVNQFGNCYSENDPTSETLFDILATDGGVITIPGAGPIYKLFPIQNGVVVFAGNGVWLITGQGAAGAFTATSYSVTKLSSIQTVSGTSFVDVQGLPYWWNNEAIYRLTAAQGDGPYGYGGFKAEPITLTTIQTFYQALPISSKAYVRGTYDPLNWIIRWLYKSTEATTINDRYNFDSVLCYNVITNAFYTYAIPNGSNTLAAPTINGIQWIQNPGGVGTPTPIIKYITTAFVSGILYNLSFAEDNDTTNWVDFFGTYGLPYVSSFTTGYKIRGQASHKEQIEYLNLYLNNTTSMSYEIQGNWDWAISRSSGKWTQTENQNTTQSNLFSVIRKRHKVDGRGLAYQFTIQAVDGQPLDIIGWSIEEKVNQGP